MERREFLKTSCSLCVGLSAGIMLGGLSSCSSLPMYKTEVANNTVKVPLSLFAESNFQLVRPNNFGFDIALQKHEDGMFSALLLSCTHAANQLNYTGSAFTCKLHGSTFDKQGEVTRGPAEHPLKKLTTHITEEAVLILVD